jgi:hypothetical protein
MSETITLVLTDERPIKVKKEAWPVVASAKDYDNQYEFQANRTWHLRVRQHADGRCIVTGTYDTAFQGERGARAGYRVAAGDDDALIQAIRDAAEAIGKPELAAACIADLPAQTEES